MSVNNYKSVQEGKKIVYLFCLGKLSFFIQEKIMSVKIYFIHIRPQFSSVWLVTVIVQKYN